MFSRIFFILTVVLIFWGLNSFLIWHVFEFFSIKIDKNFILITLVFAIQLPLSMILHSEFPSFFTKRFYYIGAIWLGVIFLGFFISFFFDITINQLQIPLNIKGIIWSILIISISGFALYNQSGLPNIKNISIKTKNLENPIKIGYLSDVHIDGIHNISYLDSIIEILNKQDIDIVLINGDLVDGTSFEKHSFKTLDRLKVPVYITFGNHESYIGKDFAMSLFKDTKAKVLENEVIDFKGLQILGIEDLMGLQHKFNEDKLDNIISRLKWNKNKASLLLLHEPLGSEIADKYNIDIQLAGHTHNGQIWPFNYIVQLAFPRVLGLYKIGNLQLYVGPGTGVWGPPMRLGSQNEITIISLEK